jgi:hypothetical protein
VLLEQLGQALPGRPLAPAAGERENGTGAHVLGVSTTAVVTPPPSSSSSLLSLNSVRCSLTSAIYLDFVAGLEAGDGKPGGTAQVTGEPPAAGR